MDEPPIQEVTFEAEGDPWRVRVLGRSRAGRTGPGAHVLLLGFWSAGCTSSTPEREVLIAGDGLDRLGPDRLRHALAAARAPVDSGRSKPFFESGRGRRGG